VFDTLVEYQDDHRYKVTISLPTIHCSSCIELLEDLPALQEGVLSCRINFERKKATIVAEKTLPISILAQLLQDIGYTPQISVSEKVNEEAGKEQKTNLFKMVVAGFCFGNIMLFSLPHYLGLTIAGDLFFSKLFSALSIALAIPVLVYSGKEYLVSAYRSLTTGKAHLNIPIAIGMLTLFFWSLSEIWTQSGIGYLDSLAGLVFFLLIGKWFQSKVYDHVSYQRNLEEFIPMVVRKVDANGIETWARLDELEAGDVLLIKNEEVIPVKGILQSGTASIDYAFVTGEQDQESVEAGQLVFAGGCQKAGAIYIKIQAKPDLNELWSTWADQGGTKEYENHWTKGISKVFTWSVIGIALAAGLLWFWVDVSKAVFVFCSVLIVACPCALALSAPFTYGNMLRVFAKNGFFFKEAEAIGVMSRVDHIVLDKTGTITKQGMAKVSFEGNRLTSHQRNQVASLTNQSQHPLSVQICKHLSVEGFEAVTEFEELPGRGIQGIVGNQLVKMGSAAWLDVKTMKATSSVVYVSIDGDVKGHFNIRTGFREGLENVLTALKQTVNISILSGDNASDKSALLQLFNRFSELKFGLKPQQKEDIIKDLKKEETVMMVGDGLNDSTAIRQGDLGIAITENLNGFYPASDAVLLGDQFSKFDRFQSLAHYSKKVLKVSLAFSLAYNLTGVAFAVSGLLTPIVAAILMPLSSITVVLLNTFLIQVKSRKLALA
jgi:Cu+-exporting ATPase